MVKLGSFFNLLIIGFYSLYPGNKKGFFLGVGIQIGFFVCLNFLAVVIFIELVFRKFGVLFETKPILYSGIFVMFLVDFLISSRLRNIGNFSELDESALKRGKMSASLYVLVSVVALMVSYYVAYFMTH